MRQLFIFYPLRIIKTSFSLSFIIGIIVILFVLPTNITAATITTNQSSKLPSRQAPTLTGVASPTMPNASTPSTQDLQNQQLISEAQNDVSIANTIIYYSGWFFAILTLVITLGGIFGIREFIQRIQRIRTETISRIDQLTTETEAHIQQLTTETEAHIQQLTTIEEQFAGRLDNFTNLFERESQILKENFEKHTHQFEESLEQQKKDFIRESQNFMEASYNFGEGTNAYKIGDNIHAVEYYLKALQLQPNNVRVMERLGRAYSNLNNMEEAIFYLEKALTLDPTNVPALRSLALCYRYTMPEKAIEYLNQSLKINPNGYEALDFLGLIHRDLGLIDEAISFHKKAINIQKRPETYFYLSILYALKGDLKGSRVMALSAEYDTNNEEHDERLRPVWKILIQSSVYIIDDNKMEALRIIQTLVQYITTQRIYNAVKGHLEKLLMATGHREWIPEFMDIVKLQES